jgi:exopolysaccharide biosynthesis WecB/TagA/CpsF family protein
MPSPIQCEVSSVAESSNVIAARSARRRLSYNVVSMIADLLLASDFICIFLAGMLTAIVGARWLTPDLAPNLTTEFERVALVAAVLAPFMLYDKSFGLAASRGGTRAPIRFYFLRLALFAGVVLTARAATPALDNVPGSWLAVWFVLGSLSTFLTRAFVIEIVRRLQHRGAITEVIAVVGAGPVADRLIHALQQTRPQSIELLGVFDDRFARTEHGTIKPIGNLAQLIELGKTRKIDWILLTLPPTAERRLLSMLQRLMALSVPIGLCPQQVGSTLPYRVVHYAGGGLPVSLLADRPRRRWDAVIKSAEDFLPRWIVTLALLPPAAIGALADRLVRRFPLSARPRGAKLNLEFDNYDVDGFAAVAASFGRDRYAYAVTPNADHVIRLHDSASFRALYAAASYILLDSRFLSHMLRTTKRLRLPVCTGSDLTAKLLSDVISPNDPLVLIGATNEQARYIRERYRLRCLAHFNPPMGFVNDPRAVETCLRFIEAHSPFRFCFLAVGAPQQEFIAQQLKARGGARGLALCIGASIDFLTGKERRAPQWIRRCGMEWLFRLLQAPGRMANRYLVRGPRVFGLLRSAEIVLRKGSKPVLQIVPDRPAESVALPSGRVLVERESRVLRA